jgi:hypothetical protein
MRTPVKRHVLSAVGAFATAATLLMSGAAAVSAAGPSQTPVPSVSSNPTACLSASDGMTYISAFVGPAGRLVLPCTPQGGQTLLITVGASPLQSSGANQNQAQGDDHLGTMTDPRVDTYAKRQAIRDQYQGASTSPPSTTSLATGTLWIKRSWMR